jgi:peptidase M15-like protein
VKTLLLLAASSLALLPSSAPLVADGFDRKTAPFSVKFDDEVSPYRDMAAFVLPSERLTIETVGGVNGAYKLEADKGAVVPAGPRRWTWQAPAKPGKYEVDVKGPSTSADDKITLHLFVMVPAAVKQNGYLNGYRIGDYPSTPLKGNALYRPPAGFIEVTRDNEDTHVTPHFRLKQFVCKQEPIGQYPKYIVLEERLLLALEAVLELANVMGHDVDTLHVMSAYRTPYYNHAIGDVMYSMHQWGHAADVFIDEHDKFRMDDLNGDDRSDMKDSRYLADRIERLLLQPGYEKFQGGIGFYPATAAHPPFVHVDVRGTRARWQG